MTERLSDIQARIGTVHQLSAVVTAMRGIAAARSREARAQVDAIRAYAAAIAHAIGQALVFLPEPGHSHDPHETDGGHAIIALCAEQGFAGTFSERVLEAAMAVARSGPAGRTELLLVGNRGMVAAAERDIAARWSAPMIAHAGQTASLANRIVETLYQRLDARAIAYVTVVHAVPDGEAALRVVQKRLMPFDFSRFPPVPKAVPPLLTLPPQVLLDRLAEEYIFAELCEAVMLSFAAENEARMRAMIAARTNVAETLDRLAAKSRQLRQEEITSEVIELAAAAGARRS